MNDIFRNILSWFSANEINKADIFISYSHRAANGIKYAENLHNRLRVNEKDTSNFYDIFIDKKSGNPSKTQPVNVDEIARHSGMMVVVGNSEAFESITIQKEIRAFFSKDREKPLKVIYPVSLSKDIKHAVWFDDINERTNGLIEKEENVSTKLYPSDEVVNEIFDSFTFPTQQELLKLSEKKIRRRGVFAIFFTIIAIASAGFAAKYANDAVNSSKTADEKTREANEATLRSKVESNRANRESIRANSEANRAMEQERIADSKTEEANRATVLAESKTREATHQKAVADSSIKESKKQQEKAQQQKLLADKQAEKASRLRYSADVRVAQSLYDQYDSQGFWSTLVNSNPAYRGIEWGYLDQLNKGEVRFENIPSERIDAVSFSPDAKYIVAHVSTTNKVLVWDSRTGSSRLLGDSTRNDSPTEFTFSPNKKWLAYFDQSCNAIVLWDISSSAWKRTEISVDKNDIISHISFSQDSKEILTVRNDQTTLYLQTWDIDKKIKKGPIIIKNFGDFLQVLAIARNGHFILLHGNYGDTDNHVSLVDSNLNVTSIKRHDGNDPLISAAFSADGRFVSILSSRTGGRSFYGLAIFDTNNVEKGLIQVPETTLLSNAKLKNLQGAQFNGNDHLLAIIFDNGIRVLDIEKVATVWDTPSDFGSTRSALVSIAQDGNQLALVSVKAKFANRWGEEIGIKQGAPGTTINSDINTLAVWKLSGEKSAFSFDGEKPVSNCVECKIAVTEDGTRLVTEDVSGNLSLWDTFSNSRITTISHETIPISSDRHWGFSDDDKYLYIQTDFSLMNDTFEKTVQLRLWDTISGNAIELSAPTKCSFASNPVFSKKEKSISVLCKEGYVSVHDLNSGKEKRRIELINPKAFASLSLAYDEKILRVSSNTIGDDTFEFSSGKPIGIDNLSIESWSPDKRWKFYGSRKDGYFLRDESRSSIPPYRLMGPNNFLPPAIKFSRDSRLLEVFGVAIGPNVAPIVFTKNLVTMRNVQSRLNDGAASFKFSPKGTWFVEETRSKLVYSAREHLDLGGVKFDIDVVLPDCSNNSIFTLKEDRLISTCPTGLVKIWDLISGQEVLSIRTEQDDIGKLSLSSDERYLLSVSRSSAKLWRLKF